MNLTPKQELFCQKFIELGNASEAYRESYDTSRMKDATINRAASQLLGNYKITTRLNELSEYHSTRHNITIDTLTNMYMAIFNANWDKNPSAAVSALNSVAKMHGHLSEHVRHTESIHHDHKHAPLSDTSRFIRESLGAGESKPPKKPVSH